VRPSEAGRFPRREAGQTFVQRSEDLEDLVKKLAKPVKGTEYYVPLRPLGCGAERAPTWLAASRHEGRLAGATGRLAAAAAVRYHNAVPLGSREGPGR
jgi:hypothetical protein